MPVRRDIVKGAGAALALYTGGHIPASALDRSDFGTPRLLLGPMMGDTGADYATIWMMASGPFSLVVEYARDAEMTDAARVPVIRPDPAQDHVVVARLTSLEPLTEYFYRVLVEGERDRYRRGMPLGKFRTAPAAGSESAFSLAFGSCARIQQDAKQPIWNAIADAKPDFFLWLGDNIYADSRDPSVIALEYHRQRGVPSYQRVGRDVPQLAVWDDHDFALNDHDRTNPVKVEALEAFKRNWANPSYGLADAPGVFFQKTIGAVDLFCLDSRYHRDPNTQPDRPGKTLLGERQREWLMDGLKQSNAIFKVLACGSGWTTAKGPGGDSWASFLSERDELLRFIRDERIEGIILVSGDTHVAEFNCIPQSVEGGYDLFECVSSPLAQRPSQSWLERTPDIRMVTPYNMSSNFGMLDFDFDGPSTATFSVRDLWGRQAWPPFVIAEDMLKMGVTSWRELSRLSA
ncbi:alkaline phosphatase D family protein [Erythrobacter rubeus]|uniref:Alkaline phosphatase D family protein n=1 Tax=Erythrobacter rubeus TaxID=2760803 RepID=A0ABR8KS82_9SPHN|nr:alkaline phosphatase D family protein [Erythrobacter rubeus]MBD2840976.1 alkaline phosphatase D family protein [Erythrobacter rubeus]